MPKFWRNFFNFLGPPGVDPLTAQLNLLIDVNRLSAIPHWTCHDVYLGGPPNPISIAERAVDRAWWANR